MHPYFQLNEISFTYPQAGRRGLPAVSLEAYPSEPLLLSGPSGSGKSTLARCLTGLIPHLYHGELRGHACVDGLPTASTPLWQLSQRAGLVFQNPASQILAPSVAEEILFGLENLGLERSEMQRRLDDSLERFGLGPFRQRAPRTLSGGEQQKLALAAILARQPQGLVLDEPLSMLDSTSALDFVDLLGEQIVAGRAMVICEHRHEYLAHLPRLRQVSLNYDPGQLPAFTSGAPTPASPEMPPAPASQKDPLHLKLRRLHARRGSTQVLSGLDLDLYGGQVTALVGPNGVGKTTLLRLLAGFQPYEGALELAEEPGRKPALGMVFQNPDLQLFNASVRQEILHRLPDPDMGYYTWLLHALGLHAYEDTPPLLLSEGEKRRLALAMVLIHRPEHGILLDEPSLGQDARHKRTLIHALRAVAASGVIVLMATHDLELAAQADRLMLLSLRGILADGPPAQVLADSSAWHELGLAIPEWVH